MLPPVPSDVARLEATALIHGWPATMSWWIRSPHWDAIDGPHAESIFAQFFSTCMPNLLGLMHNESSFGTCRLFAQGFVATSFAPPNVGAWTGATEIAVAAGLKWITRETGRRGWSMSYVPACPSAFVDNHATLSETGVSTLRAQGLSFMQAMNAMTGPLGGLCEIGTLQRKRSGAALPASLFVGYADVYPILKLVTCARRVPRSGRTSPL